MRKLRIVLTLLALTCLAASEPQQPPALPKLGLFKPTFLTLNGSWSAGTAFIIKSPSQDEKLMLVPDHLFGPDAGLDNQMSPDQIAEQVCGVAGLSMQDKSTIVTAGASLKLADAHPSDRTGTDKDLAVFPVTAKSNVDGFVLAEAPPEKGAAVWMYARLRGQTEPRLFLAVVVRSSDTQLVYRFTGGRFDAAGTSGAPVLDSSGKVVGMNVAGNESSSNQYGFANPATSIRAELTKIHN